MRDGVPALRARARRARRAGQLLRRRAARIIRAAPSAACSSRGFLAKMLRTNAAGMYGWRTLLYGTLLPGPQIAALVSRVTCARWPRAGHEVGVHGYDHVYWHDRLARLVRRRDAAELARGLRGVRASSSGDPARAFAAPGWQCTGQQPGGDRRRRPALSQLHARQRPVPADRRRPRRFATVEIPTTWPTLERPTAGSAPTRRRSTALLPRAAAARPERAHHPRRGRGLRCCRCSRRCSTRCASGSSSSA